MACARAISRGRYLGSTQIRSMNGRDMATPSAVVLTATTGKTSLDRTISSVLTQTHANVSSYVIVDGEEYFADANRILEKYRGNPRVTTCFLPRNTGGDNFFCHRIYGAFSYLVNQDYVFFCNHDDWFDENHVEKNVSACVQNDSAWSFSPRKIMAEDGSFVCNDECESLGLWPVWYNDRLHHVDANCYCLRRDLAITVAPLWYRRRIENGQFIKCADTEICEYLLRNRIKGCLTHGFSVNFSLGGNQWSPDASFFLRGNVAMVEQNRKLSLA